MLLRPASDDGAYAESTVWEFAPLTPNSSYGMDRWNYTYPMVRSGTKQGNMTNRIAIAIEAFVSIG